MTALYCFIIVMFIPLILALGSIPFRVQQESLPNIRQPREQAARLTGAGARITHAQNNSWEALLLFSSTLLVVFLTGTDLRAVSLPCLLFVAARVSHATFYLLDFAWARFASFALGTAMLIWILLIALQ
jgi:uncharacterized MAPEG superfamily protein